MAHGVFTAFSLTGDGASMVMDEGTFDHSVWAVPLADVTKETVPEDRRVAHASTAVSAAVSPDGATLLVRRTVPTSGGHSEIRYSLMPYEGGAETPLLAAGVARRAIWSDAQHVATLVQAGSGLRLSEVDVHTGAQRNRLDITDSLVADFAALPNGWAWIPVTRDRVIVSVGGRRREQRLPSWFGGAFLIAADRARDRVLFAGANQSTGDSVGVAMLSLGDGKVTMLGAHFAENARIASVTGHDALFAVGETQDSWTLFTLDAPGTMTLLGKVGRPISAVSVSSNMSRAALMVIDYRADAWLNRVVTR
jgi:hypothetical protein